MGGVARRSAEQGYPPSTSQLAHLYYNGRGVSRDVVRAFHLFGQAARSGLVTAQYNVGVMYGEGVGTAPVRSKARQWLERAADKGHEKARQRLKSLSVLRTDAAIGPGKVLWAAKRANVRAGPGTSYRKVGLLGVGEAVQVIERTGSWLRLRPRPGQPERFVYAPLLSETKRTAQGD